MSTSDNPTGAARLPLVAISLPPRMASAMGKPPLLLLLHGVGSNERDLLGLAPELDPRFHILSLRAPLVRGGDAFAWFKVTFAPEGFVIDPQQLASSRRLVAETIAAAVAEVDADPQQVYLLGFSQGAIMSLCVAMTEPELLAGVVALSGRIPPEAQPWLVTPERTTGLPIFLAHGRADSIIPFSWAERAKATLEQQGVALTYKPNAMGHTVSAETLRDLAAWLTARLDAPRWRV